MDWNNFYTALMERQQGTIPLQGIGAYNPNFLNNLYNLDNSQQNNFGLHSLYGSSYLPPPPKPLHQIREEYALLCSDIYGNLDKLTELRKLAL